MQEFYFCYFDFFTSSKITRDCEGHAFIRACDFTIYHKELSYYIILGFDSFKVIFKFQMFFMAKVNFQLPLDHVKSKLFLRQKKSHFYTVLETHI